MKQQIIEDMKKRLALKSKKANFKDLKSEKEEKLKIDWLPIKEF